MSKGRIITDNLDLSIKNPTLFEDFYKNQKSIQLLNSYVNSDAKKNEEKEELYDYYGLVSTSDKEINYRTYDKESWKSTVIDGKWVQPYKKPIMRNHDIYFGDAAGRITESFFYDHATEVVCSDNENNKLPKEVLDFYKSIGAFNDGSGSVIVKFEPSKYTADRIASNLDVTLSQSSIMEKSTCNICGKDYYSCEHYAGYLYEIEEDGVKKNKKCIVQTKDYIPVEVSIVNFPANDTSVIFRLKKSTDVPSSNDFYNSSKITTDESKNNNQEKGEKELMYKDMAKKHILSKVSDFLTITEDNEKCFSDFFETLQEDQLELTEKLLTVIADSYNKKINELKEKQEQELQDSSEEKNKKENEEEKTKDNKENSDTEEKLEEKNEANKKNDNNESPESKFYSDDSTKGTVDESPEISAMIRNYFK